MIGQKVCVFYITNFNTYLSAVAKYWTQLLFEQTFYCTSVCKRKHMVKLYLGKFGML